MDVSLFDFDLPEDRIALRPSDPRDSARMMVIYPDGRIEHAQVRDLPGYLRPGDALVANDTRVLAARLHGLRLRDSGPAKIELLLHRRLSPNSFSALARPARKLIVGNHLAFGPLSATVTARGDGGAAEVAFDRNGAALDMAIAELGEMPLPPYIAGRRAADARDVTDYQTIYARQVGSVAAPTAGLHFTPGLLSRLEGNGVAQVYLTLHVGLGTFLPVTADDTGGHHMHSEHALLTAGAASRLNKVHDDGGRILATGTTTLRTLETAADESGRLRAFDGETDIFITPGYQFRAVDMLLTNFHLPRSTLFMLVAAFMGLDVMKKAYMQAVREGYRFYSYGDACLLMRS